MKLITGRIAMVVFAGAMVLPSARIGSDRWSLRARTRLEKVRYFNEINAEDDD